MQVGVDSWMPAEQWVIDQLKKVEGFSFWAFYVGGTDLFNNQAWPKEAVDLLKANNIKPLPIYVPKQDCTENPVLCANEAMKLCEAVGVTGVVVIDSEHSMANALNYQWWLDVFAETIHAAKWLCVTYSGAGYVATNTFNWTVHWGEHEVVPNSGEAVQYGPYAITEDGGNANVSNNVPHFNVDGDTADDHFPFAEYIDATSPTQTVEPIQTTPQGELKLPKELEDQMLINMNDGQSQFLVNLSDRWKKKYPDETEGSAITSALGSNVPTVTEACPKFLSGITEVL